MDNCKKFKVERLESTRSGNYAVYHSERGVETWTANFGFNVGDEVEFYNYDGYAPEKIIVNGVETWGEDDRKKWWDSYDKSGTSWQNPYRTEQ